jgi:hypothetical protein
LGDSRKTKRAKDLPRRRVKKLRPELLQFLDNAVIPALVEMYLAKR